MSGSTVKPGDEFTDRSGRVRILVDSVEEDGTVHCTFEDPDYGAVTGKFTQEAVTAAFDAGTWVSGKVRRNR